MREFWNTTSAYFYGGRRVARLVSRRERWFALCAYCLCGDRLHNRSDVRHFGQEAVQRSRVQEGLCRKVLALRSGRRRAYAFGTRVIGAGSVLRTAVYSSVCRTRVFRRLRTPRTWVCLFQKKLERHTGRRIALGKEVRTMMKIKGVDLSYCRGGGISFPALKQAGVKFRNYPCRLFHEERCYYG